MNNTKFTQIRGRTRAHDSKPEFYYRSQSHHRFFLNKKYYDNIEWKPYHIELEEDERDFLRKQGWGSSS